MSQEALKTAAGDGGLPTHWAAEHSYEVVLEFLHEVVPDTLKAADENGKLPAHAAAQNGHEGVLQFLHKVVPRPPSPSAVFNVSGGLENCSWRWRVANALGR